MASMKLEEQLEEQPTEKKPCIDNCQEEGGNASNPNESDLPKSAERDKESTTLPSSRPHYRKLPAELNQQIYLCFNTAAQRKFIYGLGWDFYAMFRQKLLKKSKQIRNPKGNAWGRSNGGVTISEDGLVANNTNSRCQNIYAEKGFSVSEPICRMDNFSGTICYYYEIKILNSALWWDFGLTDGEIPRAGWIGESPNSYVIGIRILNPNVNFYPFFLPDSAIALNSQRGVILREPKKTGNVYGCGILINPDDKLAIFFTENGFLIDRQFPIEPTVDHLAPTVTMWDMSLEANFGDNPAKPFEYDIKKCPGMGLEWI